MTQMAQELSDDRALMSLCLELAARGAGYTSPNPMVGAIIVKDGKILAEGWHRRWGEAHAEIECLKDCTKDPAGATMYVNLEPCAHHGKTPPCAVALIDAGIRKVVIGMKDPNPLVNGRGIRMLKAAGVEVHSGVLEEECEFFNRHFITQITEQRPYVHIKVAQTVDGRIAGGSGSWISSEESRKLVHRWRAMHDAVFVGASTVRVDRPSLTVRAVRGRQPAVVVLDGALRLNAEDMKFPRASHRRVIVCTTLNSVRRRRHIVRALARGHVELFALHGRGTRLALPDVLQVLHEGGIRSILVEGGGEVFRQFALAGLADEWSIFIAPKTFGRGKGAFEGATLSGLKPKAQTLGTITSMKVGPDVLVRAFAKKYPNHVVSL